MLNTCCLKWLRPVDWCGFHDTEAWLDSYGDLRCHDDDNWKGECALESPPTHFKLYGHRWHKEALEDAAG